MTAGGAGVWSAILNQATFEPMAECGAEYGFVVGGTFPMVGKRCTKRKGHRLWHGRWRLI